MTESNKKLVCLSDGLKTLFQPATDYRLNFIVGGLAGCVAKTAIAPFDRAKINFQSSSLRFSVRSLMHFLKNTYQETGFCSLWRGNTATLVRIFPYASIQYSAHEKFKHLLGIDQKDLSHMKSSQVRMRRFLAGSLAGTTSVVCTYPLDFSRARLAVTSPAKYANVFDAIRKVRTEEGILTVYSGFKPTILGIIPYAGTSFFTFETLKEYRLNVRARRTGAKPEKLHPFENVCCGAVAGVLGQTSAYPLDIVRRRMQTAGATGHPEYSYSILKTLRLIYRTEGLVHGLYKGLSLNWIKGPTAQGISFTVFHQLQHMLHKFNDKSSHKPGP